MASLKQYLFISVAVAALATTLSAPASAQYHQFRSDKPSVEIDLGALAPESAAPAARPAWQQPSEEDLRANPPPVVLRQPLPPQKPAPVLRAPQVPATAPQAAAPVTPPAAPKPAKRVLKPLFAAPVTPPAVAEAPPVKPLAEPVPVRTPVPTAAAAAEPAESLYEKIPEMPRTAGKPSRISAPLTKSRLSYPPADTPRGDLKHFGRPVLPEGLRADEGATAYAAPGKSAPAAKPAKAAAKPAAKPAEAGIATPRRPSLVIINEDPIDLPRRMPVTTTLSPPAAAEKKADKAHSAAVEMPRPRPAARPSLQRIQIDESAAPVAPAAEIAALPAPKPLENIPPPLTEQELAQIGQNIEAVPARVALAPPRLAPQEIAVPTMADLTLEFDGASSELNETTRQKLVNIVPHLKESESRRLAVHAYASGEDGSKSSARRISLSRALAVRAFLMDNGVQPTRVDVRALGLETDRKPLERVDLVFAR